MPQDHEITILKTITQSTCFMKLNTFLFAILITATLGSCTKDPADTGSGSIDAKVMNNEAYGTDPKQKMDIYLPANRSVTATKVLILVHGGGWTQGDKAEFTPAIMDTLKKRLPDYAIFNINYRLAAFPNNLFPTQEIDVKAAVEFIYGNRSSYLVSDKFVLMGASAGAHLSLLQAYKYRSTVKIKAVVDFFGPTDMVDLYNNPGIISPLAIAALMSGTPATNPTLYQQSSPIQFVDAQNCPTIIIQGGLDPLVNATTQSLALANKLTLFNVANEYVLYPTGGHGDDWSPATFTDAYNKIQAFLATHVQ
ncbi:MAG: alpha/beta hydrolase [Chitinophagaceae bacterium]|nr:alpha/beta hydrolase [Chitinophagaceae bacterium]